jgi:hypothetical protein
MPIWNEIQEQMKELHQLLEEQKQLNNLYNNYLKNQYDGITDPE